VTLRRRYMQHPEYSVPSIHLPRTRVNRSVAMGRDQSVRLHLLSRHSSTHLMRLSVRRASH